MPVSAVTARSILSSSSSVLSQGAKGAEVASLQQALRDAGFDPGPIDGDFGPRTRAAVVAFQQARGLTVDGVVGPQTWGALRGAGGAPAAAPVPSGGHPQLSQGARGGAVTELQQKLAAAGFDPGGVDGDFGPMTRSAVVRFQTANGLSVDGVVGPQTWGALDGGSFVQGPGSVGGVNPGSGDFRSRILAIAQAEVGNVEASNNNDGSVTKYPNYFGRGHIGAINGVMRPLMIIGSATGPLAVAALFDLTESWHVAFGLVIAIWLTSAASIAIARPPKGHIEAAT